MYHATQKYHTVDNPEGIFLPWGLSHDHLTINVKLVIVRSRSTIDHSIYRLGKIPHPVILN